MIISNKKYISRFISIILLCFLIISCDKDFLNIPPEGEMTPEDFFSSEEVANQLVTAVYDQLSEWDTHSFSWIGITCIASDNADKGSDPGDTGTDKHQLDDWTFSVDALSFNEIWVSHYNGITRANRAIDLVPDLEIEETLKKQLEGEARFLRAYFYFNLVRCFGGVPKLDKVPDPTSEEDINNGRTRASVDEIYQLIIEDLKYAKGNLKSKSVQTNEEVGHATSGAAKTFLAKVYLYQENWNEVLNLTNEIIDSAEYRLLNNYALIWREAGENSDESIFEVQCSGETPNNGIDGYSVIQGVRGQHGWGFNSPSEDLDNSYEPGDARKDATIIYPGEVMWDGDTIISDPPNPRYNEKAYVSKTMESFNGIDWPTNKNMRIFRYAEVLLMNAEAANELGKTNQALTSLNDVRSRALLNDTSTTDQDELRKLIWHERRVELAMEHDRLFDLRRQGRAGEVLRAHGKNFVDNKHELFPIPQRQIELSGGMLIQNHGYR